LELVLETIGGRGEPPTVGVGVRAQKKDEAGENPDEGDASTQ
jgi:hypothetical protein